MKNYCLGISSASLLCLLLASSSNAIAQSQKAEGECNSNVIGSGNSIYCNRRIGPPSRVDALSQIRNEMSSPIGLYDVLDVRYKNGYSTDDTIYVVVSEIDIRLNVGCSDFKRMEYLAARSDKGGDRGQSKVTVLVAAFAMLKLFGSDCKSGDEYTLTREKRFRYTERGWILIGEDD